jgi:hypothetical protein
MSPRTRATAILVASVALVLGSFVAWVMLRDQGVGNDLAQVTAARTAVEDRSQRSEPRPQPPVETPAEPAVATITGGLVDATVIPAPAAVTPPQRVSIPSVGIDLPIIDTGVAPDGQMELPDDPGLVGWYRFGPLPGDPTGSAVLGGHVDSIEYGVGPLSRLPSVQPGADVMVTAADGRLLRYQVRSVERIYKAALPVDRIFAPDGPHQLTVITCGGRFLGTGLGYEDNIVVVAVPAQGATP